jgi:predicted transcriptional regulator
VPDSIVKETIREIEPLAADELIGAAARILIDAELPALPAVEADGAFAGIFGEREFMTALFPGYVQELASSAMISRSVDETIERRAQCSQEPIRNYLTTDHVLVEDEFSDTQLAELFLHHRVLIIPIATKGRIHAVITRSEFFRALVGRFGEIAEDRGAEGRD